MGTINLSDFKDFEFPINKNILYVLFFRQSDKDIPFYVGQSSRNIGRFGDYLSANFSCSTDFKVGEAIKYLNDQGIQVFVKIKASPDKKKEEKRIIDDFQKSYNLLNNLPNYDYK